MVLLYNNTITVIIICHRKSAFSSFILLLNKREARRLHSSRRTSRGPQ